MKVLFRLDANPQLGIGHLQRSLALASALETRDVASVFLTDSQPDNRERVGHFGFHYHATSCAASWGADDSSETVRVASNHGCQAIVVDNHDAPAKYLQQLRRAGFFIIARDDQALFPFNCQLVLNGNADAPQLPYRSSSGDTQFLLGTEYAVMRQEFWEMPAARPVRPDVETILVTVGGADHYNLIPGLLREIDNLSGDFSVTVVIGPYAENAAGVKLAAAATTHRVELAYGPYSMAPFMLEADLAVSAGGQTLYELACVGCPTVAIRVAQNQEGQLKALEAAGVLLGAGNPAQDDVVNTVRRALSSLMLDSKSRVKMAAAGQQLIDGKGALRAAEAIAQRVNQYSEQYA